MHQRAHLWGATIPVITLVQVAEEHVLRIVQFIVAVVVQVALKVVLRDVSGAVDDDGFFVLI